MKKLLLITVLSIIVLLVTFACAQAETKNNNDKKELALLKDSRVDNSSTTCTADALMIKKEIKDTVRYPVKANQTLKQAGTDSEIMNSVAAMENIRGSTAGNSGVSYMMTEKSDEDCTGDNKASPQTSGVNYIDAFQVNGLTLMVRNDRAGPLNVNSINTNSTRIVHTAIEALLSSSLKKDPENMLNEVENKTKFGTVETTFTESTITGSEFRNHVELRL